MATATTILDYAQRTLGFDRSDIEIPGIEETQLLEICNQAVIEFYEAHRKGGGEPPAMFQKETGATLTADTVTGEEITTATTDFDVTLSTAFDSSGALAVVNDDEPDYIKYTGNAANNFTGVTGVGYTHASGSAVSRLYALPDDFNDFRSEPNSPDGTSVDGVPHTFTAGMPIGTKFHRYDDGTTQYMHFPEGLIGNWTSRYNAKPTVVDGAADNVDIPTPYLWFAVWRIVQYAAPIVGKMDQFQIATSRADVLLRDALITRNVGKRPKVRPLTRRYIYTSRNADYR